MTKKKAVIMLEYKELKKVVNREVSLVVYLFSVSKEMVRALHLLTHLLPSYKNQSIDLLCNERTLFWSFSQSLDLSLNG